MPKIRVLFSCFACASVKVPLEVPARGAEDVKTWLDATLQLVGAAHRKHSPACRGDRVDLAIPVDGAAVVGGPPVH